MRVVTKKPWWWAITGQAWGNVAMTWGNTVYIRQDRITSKVLRHEACHVKQHRGSWWVALYHFIRSTMSVKYYNRMENEAKQCE